MVISTLLFPPARNTGRKSTSLSKINFDFLLNFYLLIYEFIKNKSRVWFFKLFFTRLLKHRQPRAIYREVLQIHFGVFHLDMLWCIWIFSQEYSVKICHGIFWTLVDFIVAIDKEEYINKLPHMDLVTFYSFVLLKKM